MASLYESTDNPFVQNTISSLRDATDLHKSQSDNIEQSNSKVQGVIDKLFGLNGKERYQLWPEKLVRDAISAPHDAMTGEIPQYAIDPVTGEAQTSPQMIKAGIDTSSLAGSGGLAGAGSEAGVALGSAPFLRPALKYEGKIYKSPMNGQHMDAMPPELYNKYQQMALSGDDISHFDFGFLNSKGHFLNREDALQYAIDNGIISKDNAKYGALTTVMGRKRVDKNDPEFMSDSSKPGTAIEAQNKDKSIEKDGKTFKLTPVDYNPFEKDK